ncbi:hypothetical protein A6747_01485 [Pseudomonas aeruginosa]|nr:hypothetical protein A6747_01485 [Pseudomonas aeruginosa]
MLGKSKNVPIYVPSIRVVCNMLSLKLYVCIGDASLSFAYSMAMMKITDSPLKVITNSPVRFQFADILNCCDIRHSNFTGIFAQKFIYRTRF